MLRVRDIKVRYRNGALGVSNVSLSVERGQVVACFGPNGAGKTTAMRAISGFLKTEGARVIDGSVVLDSQDITRREPHRTARAGIAFIPDRGKVFPNLTVRENLLALGRLPSRARQGVILNEIYELFPVLADRSGEFAGRLSGGEQQKLAIGRGFMTEPKLLIMDEMTLGLHTSVLPPLAQAVRHAANNGTAVLIVDESADFALGVADYVYVLRSGMVHTEGNASRFHESDLLGASYVGEETGS